MLQVTPSSSRRYALPPLISWKGFLNGFQWSQGEHVILLGPTGKGKTTVGLSVLPKRRFVLVIATKPRDPLLSKLKKQGFYVTREWPVNHMVHPKVVFWPRSDKMRDAGNQAYQISRCLEDVYERGGWTVYCDEIRDLAEMGLKNHLTLLYRNGRALKISMVGGSQRPFWIPKESYSMATHLILFRTADDAGRLGEISGSVNAKEIEYIVNRLPMIDNHPDTTASEFLYVNLNTGDMVRSKGEKR